ncbi:serine/threonine-protein kinase [Mycobacterium sp. Marseille-P9652]|uniref:serine/threonine-protein kinase n=1 Tax=Mycobacterium sp. Marseille-P9652 TaxID=2654950 RepID=UPI0012E71BE2|nr:serine/threonine-protein kinase [Mycobacterium sp. Marseille-P9652]
MDEHKGTTRRLDGRRLLSNPRQAREALRAGFQSLPSATVAHFFRRVPPVSSTPNVEPEAAPPRGDVSGSRLAVANGSPFAGYTILRQLGAGGMAEVYLALHPRLPRRDVIKVLAEAVTADPEFRERFNREADLAATLWHPHIVGVHDRGEFNGQLWISMDYVEGTDAARLVKERYSDGMPIDEVSAIVQAVAGALDYAHDRGLLHRDVKPANILLTHPEDGERRIVLADFGVARHLGDISGITETNVAVGTVAYAAPEQLTGGNIDGRADQYALAATAFHLLTGTPPFQHSNPIAVISQHLHEDPPLLSDYRPELAALDDVFSTALAKRPADRFERCRAFAAALSERVDAMHDDADGADPGAAPVAPHRRRGVGIALRQRFSSRARWATALVCAVLIAVAATWSVLYSVQPDGSPGNPSLALRPSVPAPSAAPVRSGGPALSGIYQLTYDRSKQIANGIPIHHDGAKTNWWAFKSVCTTKGCAATAVKLDDADHRKASTDDGGRTDTLRFVGGYWQGSPQQERVSCAEPGGPAGATQQETIAWSLAPQADGTLRGTVTETVLSNDCGAQGAVVRVPVVANRTGDVPAGLSMADPAQAVNTTNPPSTPGSPPVLGGLCSDIDKLAYDPTNNEQIVCEGSSWARAPITTGVHASGSSCDRPGLAVFAMTTSNDGHLLECDPVTRTWARPAG